MLGMKSRMCFCARGTRQSQGFRRRWILLRQVFTGHMLLLMGKSGEWRRCESNEGRLRGRIAANRPLFTSESETKTAIFDHCSGSLSQLPVSNEVDDLSTFSSQNQNLSDRTFRVFSIGTIQRLGGKRDDR